MTVLFVITSILFFLTIDWISRRVRHETTVPITPRTATQQSEARTPDGIFFTPSHTWLNLFPSGKVRLGVDDFVSRMMDKPEITLLKNPGETVHKGDPLLSMKEGDHLLTVRSPIDADIVTLNDGLSSHPDILKTALFSEGWAYTLKPLRFSDLKQFSLGPETRSWMRIELGRLRDFFAAVAQPDGLAPAMLQDGGTPAPGAMKFLDDSAWHQFEEEFLAVYNDEREGQ